MRRVHRAWGLLFLRCSASGMLLAGHGWDKLLHVAENAAHFPDPLGLGSALSMVLVIFAESICTVFVMLGLLTRLAALPVLLSLVTAALVVHADDPWSKKEFALLYALPFFTVTLMGPGRFSFDALRRRRRARLLRRTLRGR